MKTRAVRLYGKNDLRLEEFELPAMQPDEILARIVTDSICMSTYKTAIQGEDHKRVPKDIAQNPVMMGHEFCGEIVEAGERWKGEFAPGERFVMQTALNYKGSMAAPGFSFPYVGGNATYIIIPSVVMEIGHLIKYEARHFYQGSLVEPMGCIIGAYHASYHTQPGRYTHDMGIRQGGSLALLGACGPMGLGAIDYALHADRRPSVLVVTDIDDGRLSRAESIFSVDAARQAGVRLTYVNTAKQEDPVRALRAKTEHGFDDVMVFAQVSAVIEQADALLARDGCLNFFAGPTNTALSANLNFYNVHYGGTHVTGTSGGNTNDMREAVRLMGAGRIDPSAMITHVGGLDSVIDTTLNLPHISGGKKLVYVQISMPMTPLDELHRLGDTDRRYLELADIVRRHNGLWSGEAEDCLLAIHSRPINSDI